MLYCLHCRDREEAVEHYTETSELPVRQINTHLQTMDQTPLTVEEIDNYAEWADHHPDAHFQDEEPEPEPDVHDGVMTPVMEGALEQVLAEAELAEDDPDNDEMPLEVLQKAVVLCTWVSMCSSIKYRRNQHQ